ncbi:polysaccharide lyase [Kibdelosporangium aridum]|nr:sugar isomerase [Kibdelosporangium aridum]
MSLHNSRLRKAIVACVAMAGLISVSAPAAQAAPAPWSGTFSGFNSSSWRSSWGIDGRGEFGFGNMKASGATLDVKYGKGSSAPSCTNCPTSGGGQFYQDLGKIGRTDLRNAGTLYFRYRVRFPSDFDWGRGGKLPGLYGGEPGQASGGNHGNAWSTRFMFRNGSKGEVYVYTPGGSGYGRDVGLGSWSFAADNQTHTIEQAVNRSTGQITVWYDNRQVLSVREAPNIAAIPFKGVFFSTFFGGHDTSWGPKREVHAYFSDFSISTTKH